MGQHERLAPAIPWLLFLMMMVFFALFPRLLLAPLLLRMSEGLEIAYSTASTFFLTASFGFITGLLTSGFISKALTHRWTIVFGIGLCGVSLLILGRLQTVFLVHLVLFTLGFGNGMYPGSGIASVTSLAPDAHRGKALALHEAGPNLAFITAPIIAAILAPWVGWRGVFTVAGVAALAASLLFAFFGRGNRERGEPPHFENLKLFITNRSFWALSVLFMLAASCAIGVYSVLPTFLIVEHGHSEAFVNSLVGGSRITGFAAIFLAGTLADRFGIRIVIGAVIAVTGLVTVFLGLLSGAALLVAVFMQPLVVQAFFPVAISALTEVAPPNARNLSVSLAIPLGNLVGSGIAPPALSAAGAAGYFGGGFLALGVLTLGSLFLLPQLRIGNEPWRKQTETEASAGPA
jgi:NNP family nitrate/nitrite transporter-like MFS transporter